VLEKKHNRGLVLLLQWQQQALRRLLSALMRHLPAIAFKGHVLVLSPEEGVTRKKHK